MPSALKISEAASLALHSMVLLAAEPGRLRSTREMADTLGVSEAHLSKVLQRLARGGLVSATRGPRGGFALDRSPEDISLLEVYETIDGAIGSARCLLGEPVCSGNGCVLGNLVHTVNEQLREHLAGTRLADAARTYAPDH